MGTYDLESTVTLPDSHQTFPTDVCPDSGLSYAKLNENICMLNGQNLNI